MLLPNKRALDVTGEKYGKLTMLRYVRNNRNRQAIWAALCDCGNITEVLVNKARDGRAISCGCQARNLSVPMVGKVFGRLTVLGIAGKSNRAHAWRCLCQCGEEVAVLGAKLRNGHTSSCGCLQVEHARSLNLTHGQTRRGAKTLTYTAWVSMWQRCTALEGKDAEHYALRGISVCPAWKSFPAFFADMGAVPQGLTLERLDVNGNYTPENCVWATRKVQNNNKRTTVRYQVGDQMLTVTQAAELWGISWKAAKKRLSA